MAEEAPYKVIERLENEVEVREYSGQIWATTISGSEDTAFMILAAYISGRNEGKTEIPMTAPVITRQVPDGLMMAFVMPPGSDMKNLPRPVSDDICIKEISGLRLAVISFPGYVTRGDYERGLKILVSMVKKKGLKTKGGPLLLQYNSPWTPPMDRRNEIAVEISNTPA